LKNELRNAVQGSLETVLYKIDDPVDGAAIKRASFEAALDGIKTGKMTYKGDQLL
jgi:hypothetical protein